MKNPLLCQHYLKSLFFLIVFAQVSGFAQPVIQWDKNFGNAGRGSGYEMSSAYRKTMDGNFIVVCTATYQNGEDKTQLGVGDSDVWIVKFTPDGSKIWDRTLVESYNSSGHTDIQPTADGGYIVCSSTLANKGFDKSEDSRGITDYWVVKLDSLGEIEWDKTLGGDQIDAAEVILQTKDGGYLVAGRSESGISGEKTSIANGGEDYWVVKLSAAGVKEWDAGFGGSDEDVLSTAKQTLDGGFIVGGYSNSPVSGDKKDAKGGFDYWLIKMNSSGIKEWEKSFGGSKAEYLSYIYPESDGGFLLAGGSASDAEYDKTENSRGSTDGWLVKINSVGEKEWDKTIGGNANDGISYLEHTLDGGYLLCASSLSGISGDKTDSLRIHDDSDSVGDYWLIKLSADHEKLWDKTIGGDGRDYPTFATEISSGKYFIGGESSSSLYYMPGDRTVERKGQADLWFLSLQEVQPPLPVTLTSFTAHKENTNALLNWQTSYEIQNDRFEVQHSIDGKTWDLIATVKPSGDVNKLANYMLVDNKPILGVDNLYRLKMIDTDGTFTYSTIESLHFDEDANFNIFPNPAVETLNINLADWHKVKSIELLNSRSDVVYNSGEKLVHSVNVKELQTGIYFLRIELVDGSTLVKKVLVGK